MTSSGCLLAAITFFFLFSRVVEFRFYLASHLFRWRLRVIADDFQFLSAHSEFPDKSSKAMFSLNSPRPFMDLHCMHNDNNRSHVEHAINMNYVHASVLKRRLNLNVAANLLSRQHHSALGEVVGCYVRQTIQWSWWGTANVIRSNERVASRNGILADSDGIRVIWSASWQATIRHVSHC